MALPPLLRSAWRSTNSRSPVSRGMVEQFLPSLRNRCRPLAVHGSNTSDEARPNARRSHSSMSSSGFM
eukprot:scaffold71014_cov64-Phaeocystis_antarctica.AAC.2